MSRPRTTQQTATAPPATLRTADWSQLEVGPRRGSTRRELTCIPLADDAACRGIAGRRPFESRRSIELSLWLRLDTEEAGVTLIIVLVALVVSTESAMTDPLRQVLVGLADAQLEQRRRPRVHNLRRVAVLGRAAAE